MSFKSSHLFEDRQSEATRIMQKYPDKIPIICEKHYLCKTVKQIEKKKYLVAIDYTCGQFLYIIRNQLKLPSEQAIFLFINDSIPPTSRTMHQIYTEHKDKDGFLYITYASENTFGLGDF
jgi:GABA(A) receptor-associated protein